jgi:hypothetical protein
MVFSVDGKRRAVDRRAPFLFSWSAKRAKPGRHVLEVIATSIDGRRATRRIPLVVPAPPKPKPTPRPKPKPVPLALTGMNVADGQEVTGLVLWRVDVRGRAERVEFLIDGVARGNDVAAPYTLGWNTSGEATGPHKLTARASGKGRSVETTVTVTVQSGPAGTATP